MNILDVLNADEDFQLPPLSGPPVATHLRADVVAVGWAVHCGNCGWAFDAPDCSELTVWASEEIDGQNIRCPNCSSNNQVCVDS